MRSDHAAIEAVEAYANAVTLAREARRCADAAEVCIALRIPTTEQGRLLRETVAECVTRTHAAVERAADVLRAEGIDPATVLPGGAKC